MKHFVFCACVLVGLATTSASAGLMTVGSVGTYTETFLIDPSSGLFQRDLFAIANTSSENSGARISRVSFELPTDIVFDISGALLENHPNIVLSHTEVGSNGLTLDFADFDPDETFTFSIDVDPALGEHMPVWSWDFAGTLFSVTFEGPFAEGPLTLTSQFAPVKFLGMPVPFMAIAGVSESVEVIPNPEPSSWILFSLGAVGLVYAARRRQSVTG